MVFIGATKSETPEKQQDRVPAGCLRFLQHFGLVFLSQSPTSCSRLPLWNLKHYQRRLHQHTGWILRRKIWMLCVLECAILINSPLTQQPSNPLLPFCGSPTTIQGAFQTVAGNGGQACWWEWGWDQICKAQKQIDMAGEDNPRGLMNQGVRMGDSKLRSIRLCWLGRIFFYRGLEEVKEEQGSYREQRDPTHTPTTALVY